MRRPGPAVICYAPPRIASRVNHVRHAVKPRIALGAKHSFLRAGLGRGGMPAELVQSDLARGTLVKIVAADAPPQGFVLSMRAVYRTEAPPGIAARWFIDRLKPGAEAPAVGKNSPPKVWGQKARAEPSIARGKRMDYALPAFTPRTSGKRCTRRLRSSHRLCSVIRTRRRGSSRRFGEVEPARPRSSLLVNQLRRCAGSDQSSFR